MLMKENIKRNDVQNIVECRICDWLDPPKFDVSWKSNVLLIADCIWVGTLIQPLINTMKRFIESSTHERDITAIIAYQRRGKQVHNLFWKEVITVFDQVEKLEIPIIKPDTLDLYKCSVFVSSNSPPLSELT
jgi:Lysine methyltransferase